MIVKEDNKMFKYVLKWRLHIRVYELKSHLNMSGYRKDSKGLNK